MPTPERRRFGGGGGDSSDSTTDEDSSSGTDSDGGGDGGGQSSGPPPDGPQPTPASGSDSADSGDDGGSDSDQGADDTTGGGGGQSSGPPPDGPQPTPASGGDSADSGDDSGASEAPAGGESESGTGTDSAEDSSLVVREDGAPSTESQVVQQRLQQARSSLAEQGYDREDVQLRVTDAGFVEAVGLTSEGRQTEEDEYSNALEGLGYEQPEGGEWEAPDSSDRDTLAEQEAQDRLNNALEGLGYEHDGENWEAPDSSDRDTLVEQEAQEKLDNALEGLGYEHTGERWVGPDSADRDTTVEERIESQIEDETGRDVEIEQQSDGSFEVEQQEQFGDAQFDVPFDGSNESFEDYLEAGSGAISNATTQASSALFDEGGVASESIIADALEAAGQEEAAVLFEENLRSFGKGTFEGAANLANVPSVALGLKEAGEFLGYAGSRTLVGEGDEVADQTRDALVSAGIGAVDAFQSNPSKASGQLVGSLVGSSAVMSAAPRSAWAIQPGEELVSKAATGAASRTATGSRLVSKLPGGKIDNEELAIAAGRKASRTLRETVDDPRVRQFLRDDRGQGQLTITKERTREEDSESSTGSGDDLSLDEELDRIRERVSEQDIRETDEWMPDETAPEAESGQQPTQDIREQETREQDVSSVEAERTPTTDVRERSDADLDQDIGVEPGTRSKDVEETIQEIDTLNQELRQQFDLGRTDAKSDVEMDATVGVGRVEPRTRLDSEEDTLDQFQGDLQEGVDEAVDEATQVAAEGALDQSQTVEKSVQTEFEEPSVTQEFEQDFESQFDQEFETEFETEFESAFESELESEFETEFEQERETEPVTENDPTRTQVQGGDESEDPWSKEFENPVTSLEDADEVSEEIDAEFEEGFM